MYHLELRKYIKKNTFNKYFFKNFKYISHIDRLPIRWT